MPTACEVPEPVILHMESPTPLTPLGAKGLAEGNCMSTPVCIANAVCDALDIAHIDLPMTAAKIADILDDEEPPPPHGVPAAAPAPAGEGHALKGSGSTLVPAAPEEVWRTLLDPDKLATVIPGCHALDVVAENAYHATVSLGVGPVRGVFEAGVRLSDLDPPFAVTLAGELSGPLGSSRGSGRVRLAATEGGTRVSYDYTVEISGKVAAVGGRWWRKLLRALGIGR